MNKAIINFCHNPIFYQIIKNNGTIYGTIIRKNIVENIPLDEIFEEPGLIISCFVKLIYKEIIERDLNKWIKSVITINIPSARSQICSYTLIYQNAVFVLDCCFIKSDLSFHLKNYQKELNFFLDIDLLYINRYQFGMLELENIHSREPIPLFKVLNNIKKKRFKIIESAIFIKKALLDYVLELKKLNWVNLDNILLNIEDLDDDESIEKILKEKCDICKNDNDEETIILPCQHYFHEKCIINYLKSFIDNSDKNDTFKCPYCTKEINIIDIL
jgi:hypothetical protein